MRRAWRAVAVTAVLSLTLAACASGDGDAGVASLGGNEGTGASASPSVDPEEALAEFAECMRENGIEDFQDPVLGEGGEIQIGVGGPDGSEGRPSEEDREELQEAMEACNDLLPQDLGPRDISEEDQAAMQDAMLEFAQCMRDHGIDFPDPEFSGDGGAFQEIGDGVDPNSDEFQEAEEACRPIIEEVRPDGGGPPATTDEGGSDADE